MVSSRHQKFYRILGVFCLSSLVWGGACGWARDMDDAELASLQLKMPSDIQIEVFAGNVPKARHMAFDDQGVLFLSQARVGKVVALPDQNRDGKADQSIPILSGHDVPHGLAFIQLESGYYLYVAEETRVIRLKR